MDDAEMLKVLRTALADSAQDEAPPARVVDAAVAAGGWTRLDGELAALVADSADEAVPAGVRGGAAEVRQLTYRSGELSIECELGPDTLIGQVLPAPAGTTVELVTPDGTGRPVGLRPDGGFLISPVPDGPVGLRCRRPGRPATVTPWLLP